MANECRSVCGETSRGHPGPLGGLDQHRPGRLPRQPAAAGVQEQRARPRSAVPTASQLGPRARQVGVDGLQGVGADRHEPLLAALAAQQHGAVDPVEVVDVEPDGLGDPGAGAVEHLEQGPVAQRQRRARRRRRPRGSPRRRPAAAPWAAAWPGAGGRTPAAGSAVASPSVTRTCGSPAPPRPCAPPRSADSGGWSASPSRSRTRNAETVCSATRVEVVDAPLVEERR